MTDFKQIMVRPTGILIEDNNILIVKQDVTDTRHWSLPGGRVELGEAMEQCLIREFKEETGLDIKVKDLLYITDRFYHGNHIIHILFLVKKIGGRLRSGNELELKTEKIKELKMVPVDALPDYGFPPNMYQLVKSGFPGRGSYRGNFEKFYGKL